MRHNYYEFLISRNKDNDLNNEEKIKLEKHLKTCESCRRFESGIYTLSSILDSKNILKAEKIKTEEKLDKKSDKKIIYFNNIKNTVMAFAAVIIFVVGITLVLKNKTPSVVDTVVLLENTDVSKTEENDVFMPLGEYFAYTFDAQNNDTLLENEVETVEEAMPMYTYFSYFTSEE